MFDFLLKRVIIIIGFTLLSFLGFVKFVYIAFGLFSLLNDSAEHRNLSWQLFFLDLLKMLLSVLLIWTVIVEKSAHNLFVITFYAICIISLIAFENFILSLVWNLGVNVFICSALDSVWFFNLMTHNFNSAKISPIVASALNSYLLLS